jgi:hypothetical protein
VTNPSTAKNWKKIKINKCQQKKVENKLKCDVPGIFQVARIIR